MIDFLKNIPMIVKLSIIFIVICYCTIILASIFSYIGFFGIALVSIIAAYFTEKELGK
jgi:uncharacterized membrane protein